MAKTKKSGGMSVMGVVVALMLGSGLVRGGLGAGAAMASADTTPAKTQQAQTSQSGKTAGCVPAQTPAALVKALNEREEQVTLREADVLQKLEALAVAREELRAEIIELEAAETALARTLSIAESASENDLDRLTAVYEAMKPADAAALFSEMAPEFAAGFLGRMSPASAAGVLAGLEPSVAYAMSAHLAGRNALAPKE